MSNVRVALPPDFFTTGCLNQTWRASLWSQHSTSCVRRSGLVAIRRGMGCCWNVERQLRCGAGGHRARRWWSSYRPKTRLNELVIETSRARTRGVLVWHRDSGTDLRHTMPNLLTVPHAPSMRASHSSLSQAELLNLICNSSMKEQSHLSC